MKKNILILSLFVVVTQFGWSQVTSKLHDFPLRITLADESISLPTFWFIDYSFNPSIQIGTERIIKEKSKSNWAIVGNAGFYYNKNWQAAVTLTGGMGYRLFFNRWNFNPRLEVGYGHIVETNPVYRLDDNGIVQKIKNYGTPLGISTLSLNVGYALNDQARSPEIFVTFASSVELPLRLPTGVHQFVGIGLQFYPF